MSEQESGASTTTFRTISSGAPPPSLPGDEQREGERDTAEGAWVGVNAARPFLVLAVVQAVAFVLRQVPELAPAPGGFLDALVVQLEPLTSSAVAGPAVSQHAVGSSALLVALVASAVLALVATHDLGAAGGLVLLAGGTTVVGTVVGVLASADLAAPAQGALGLGLALVVAVLAGRTTVLVLQRGPAPAAGCDRALRSAVVAAALLAPALALGRLLDGDLVALARTEPRSALWDDQLAGLHVLTWASGVLVLVCSVLAARVVTRPASRWGHGIAAIIAAALVVGVAAPALGRATDAAALRLPPPSLAEQCEQWSWGDPPTESFTLAGAGCEDAVRSSGAVVRSRATLPDDLRLTNVTDDLADGQPYAGTVLSAGYGPVIALATAPTASSGLGVVGLQVEDTTVVWRHACPASGVKDLVRFSGSDDSDGASNRITFPGESGPAVLLACAGGPSQRLDPQTGALLP